MVLPPVVVGVLWKAFLIRGIGGLDYFLEQLHLPTPGLLETANGALSALILTVTWEWTPFVMLLLLAGLESLPEEPFEAARVDGASRWRQFTGITLPSLKPALVPAVILSVVWTFNMFNIIYLVSNGDPAHSTEILITQAYKLAFEQYRYGYAAAYSVVIFLILLGYGTWQNRVTRATEGI
jgi:arabinogalactan oligomer/maltooligosaccharide transport system permease protein